MTRNRANDTSAAGWNAQQAALTRMSPESRIRVAIDLSESVREIQIQGILARNPAWSRAAFGDGARLRAHWLAMDPGSHRLIVGAMGVGEDRMLMARHDPATGELSWDETLRERNGFPGIDFRRPEWPHDASGLAFGHAAVFGNRVGWTQR